MEEWKRLEFEYAKKLRETDLETRRALYFEAYNAVAYSKASLPASGDAEQRTAGTSRGLVRYLASICRKTDAVLEIGCGRGYTCLGLAPHVDSIIGTDVSEPSLREADELLKSNNITNAKVMEVGAFDIDKHFQDNTFDKVITIDVLEHLHPEDAKEHLAKVFSVLKPNGQMIIVMPNSITGPNDITREEYPDATEAIGFHLNETTYAELGKLLHELGFIKFQSFLSHNIQQLPISGFKYPSFVSLTLEKHYDKLKNIKYIGKISGRFLGIKFIARKPS